MPGFVNLHTKSHYSFLDGASSVDDLLDAAVELGQDALALTDTNGLYGAVRFWNAARASFLPATAKASLLSSIRATRA